MPRASSRRSVPAKVVPSKKCVCNPGYMILAVVLLTLGLYAAVAGFVNQFTGASATAILPAYFVGVLLLVFGKMCKRKSCAMCTVHP